MKAVSEVLGVARSALAQPRLGVRARHNIITSAVSQVGDAELVQELSAVVAHLPSYGYRRAWALVQRQREAQGGPLVNHKRVYRVMRDHGLLTRRRWPVRSLHRHDDRVAVGTSNTCWCSDGFEFRCDNGEPGRSTFALDCCAKRRSGAQRDAGGRRATVWPGCTAAAHKMAHRQWLALRGTSNPPVRSRVGPNATDHACQLATE